jgi:hypothetical protein
MVVLPGSFKSNTTMNYNFSFAIYKSVTEFSSYSYVLLAIIKTLTNRARINLKILKEIVRKKRVWKPAELMTPLKSKFVF